MMSKKELLKGIKQSDVENLKKPFGFCCDERSQDFSTKYDQRNPPFASSLTNIVLNGGGPNFKFRVKDILPKSFRKSGIHRDYFKSTTANLGGCRWCRGPIKWYLEDEISVCKEMIAKNKQQQYNEKKEKDVAVARRKILNNRKRKKDTTISRKLQRQDEISSAEENLE